MKSSDVIIIGAGIIGLSLAISLRRQGLRVLIVEGGEPGREASSAAAGMLAAAGAEIPAELRTLAAASARLYPGFAHELEDESGLKVDLREQGTILISASGQFPEAAQKLSAAEMLALEPGLASQNPREKPPVVAAFLSERSVDPRALVQAAIRAAKHRDVHLASGHPVQSVLVESGRASGIETGQTKYAAAVVVNCAGAWAGGLGPVPLPVRPVKGQMLSLVAGAAAPKHVVRGDHVYVVPRSDGRVVIGSTLEDAGFDKRTQVSAIQQLLQSAVALVPGLAEAKVHEDWAGLRPGTPDELPILGETSIPGYFVATGHYRDGILLAPVTAQVMTDVIIGNPPAHDLSAFAASRFSHLPAPSDRR
jgi:glycine oxidase